MQRAGRVGRAHRLLPIRLEPAIAEPGGGGRVGIDDADRACAGQSVGRGRNGNRYGGSWGGVLGRMAVRASDDGAGRRIQVNVGCVVMELSNWSSSSAENCTGKPPTLTLADDGVTAMRVGLGTTVIPTVGAVAGDRPPPSVIVTWKVYGPATLTVAIMSLPALVPLMLLSKVGSLASCGFDERNLQVYVRFASPAGSSSVPRTESEIVLLAGTCAAVAAVTTLGVIGFQPQSHWWQSRHWSYQCGP